MCRMLTAEFVKLNVSSTKNEIFGRDSKSRT